MSEKTLKEKTAKGLLWGVLNNGLMQAFNLGFGIILAKLLTPSDYGMVGVLAIFAGIAGALQEGGFISALNQKKDVCHEDYNAVFWFSLLTSLLLYAIGFAAAPFIALLFHEPKLTALSRYVFLGFLFSGLCIVPKAVLFRELRVRETSTISICALFVSGIVGVTMAASGYAYWGIATQGLIYVALVFVLSSWRARWTPSLSFSLTPLKEMAGFGSKLMLTNLFNVVNNHLFTFFLGVSYTKVDVGNFTQANKWNTMGHSTLSGMLNGITQPLFTKVNDSAAEQQKVFRKLLRFTAFLSFPAMLGLAVVAEDLIVLAIGEKWNDSAQLLRQLCVLGAFVPISALFSNYLISRGRSGVYLGCTIGLAVAQTLFVLSEASAGIEAMLQRYIQINLISIIVWHHFVRKENGLRLRHLLLDLAPYLLLSAALFLVLYFVFDGVDHRWLRIVFKITTFVGVYLGVLFVAGSTILQESFAYFFKKKR